MGNAGAGGSGAGGSGSTGAGGGAGSADWVSRISGPEVVWHHDFESAAEVDAFRWTSAYGNDPLGVGSTLASNLSFVASEGVDGNGCLEILRPAGSDEVGSHWWRPLSPIVGTGNGRGVDDPGASGAIPAQAYASTDHGSQISNWGDRGFYGHSSYHAGGGFDGTEYYLQLRVKMDPRRTSAGMPAGGKLTYQTRCDLSFTTQEIVTYSGGLNSNNPGENYFRMYGGGNTDPLEQKAIGGDGGDQPNNAEGLCEFSENPNTCWAWSGGWDTIMVHLRPGRADMPESLIEIYAAHEGETTYTKIWDMTWANDYGAGQPFGYNALILSTYHNGNDCPSEFWHRYDQIILSRAFIPCPEP